MLRPECLGETVTVRWPAVQHLPSQGHTHTHTDQHQELESTLWEAGNCHRRDAESARFHLNRIKLSPEDNAVKFLIYFLPLP